MIRYEASSRSALEEGLPIPHLRQADDDTSGLVILCKIAHTWERRQRMSTKEGLRCQVSGRAFGFPET